MEYVVLGWPPDEPTLRLDYRRFAYAGKFVMSDTGKAVVVTGDGDPTLSISDDEYDDGVLAAVSFSPDRTREGVLWLRYVTVRDDQRGDGLGPRLCRLVVERAGGRGYTECRIAVNNPFAYEALHRSGFGWTGDTAGMAELVLSTDAPRTTARYRAGIDALRDRDPGDPEASFLASRSDTAPPVVEAPAACER